MPNQFEFLKELPSSSSSTQSTDGDQNSLRHMDDFKLPALASASEQCSLPSTVVHASLVITEADSETKDSDDDDDNDDDDDDDAVDEDQEHHHDTSPVEKNNLLRGRPSACVFVASLCSNMSDDDLCISVTDHFKKWGDLSTVKVLRDTSNRPYAFVQYNSEAECQLAIARGHNSLLNGRKLRCEQAKVNRTLFLSSPVLLSEVELKNNLEDFGEFDNIKSSNVNGTANLNRSYNEPSNFWFIKFTYRDDAIRAFASLTERNFFQVEWAKNIDDNAIRLPIKKVTGSYGFDKFSIFIGQLNPSITEEELTSRFKLHGEISEFSIIRKPLSTFAFITFKNETSAASAVERENHTMLKNKTIHVQYREVHPPPKVTELSAQVGLSYAPPPINLLKRAGYSKMVNPNFNNYSNSPDNYRASTRNNAVLYNYKKSTDISKKPLKLHSQHYDNKPKPNSSKNMKGKGSYSNERTKSFNVYHGLENGTPKKGDKKQENNEYPDYNASSPSSYFYYLPPTEYAYDKGSKKYNNTNSGYYNPYFYGYEDQENYAYPVYYPEEYQ